MRTRRSRYIPCAVFLAFLLLILVGPFLIPVPPLEATLSIEELADPDSQFIEINGLNVHYKVLGEGEPVFILLHGFGANLYTWHKVMEPLSRFGNVIAYDRPAFGLTERPFEWEDVNPYGPEAQVELVTGLMDALGAEQAILVGNSAGGTIAVQTALTYPDRVKALILVDAAIYSGGGSPRWIKPLLRTPQMRHLGPLIARQIQERGPELIELAWHDPTSLSADDLEGYRKPLLVPDWDKALWEMTLASEELDLAPRLDEINIPTLVISGESDRIVPVEQSVQLAEDLLDAQLVIIPACGHVPQEECVDIFMQAVENFLDTLFQ